MIDQYAEYICDTLQFRRCYSVLWAVDKLRMKLRTVHWRTNPLANRQQGTLATGSWQKNSSGTKTKRRNVITTCRLSTTNTKIVSIPRVIYYIANQLTWFQKRSPVLYSTTYGQKRVTLTTNTKEVVDSPRRPPRTPLTTNRSRDKRQLIIYFIRNALWEGLPAPPGP